MRAIRTVSLALALSTALPLGAGHAQTVSKPIAAALADPARADQQGDDARRQAAAVLAFAGVGPGDRVVEFFPGQGYWTRLLAGVVGPRGHVLAVWPHSGAHYAEHTLPALQARGLANVEARVLDGDTLPPDGTADLVWTVQNYHDINNLPGGAAAIDAFNRSAFAALQPGGRYVVIDHVDGAGTGLTGTSTRHRIEPAVVRRQIEAAGFRFAGESQVLRNPADPHTANVFDPSIRGHTDQFVYRFVKPAR